MRSFLKSVAGESSDPGDAVEDKLRVAMMLDLDVQVKVLALQEIESGNVTCISISHANVCGPRASKMTNLEESDEIWNRRTRLSKM